MEEPHGAGDSGHARPPGALDGLVVIDMTRVVAGPLAGQMLADLGAEVIKIERLGGGDDLRSLGPPWVRDRSGEDTEQSTYFQTVNRGKLSVALDFSRPEGAEVLRRLAAKADVLIENFRPGTLDRYGLGQAALSALNPGLVYCSITGFGHTGPYRERSGYDYLVQAMGGQMAITGHPEGTPGAGPMRVGVPIADITAGQNAVVGILAALMHRERTGKGQHVDVSLYDSQVSILLNNLGGWLNAGLKPARTGNDHPTAVPNGIFPTSDGHILIATFNDREFARLAEALGHAEWASDARFSRSRDRVAHRATLVAAMSAILSTETRAVWMERLHVAKVSCGPIQDMADIERDPQLAAREMIVEVEHPAVGPVRVVGNPTKLSATPVSYRRAPPLPGEHTETVLRAMLGLGPDEIESLRAASVI